MLHSQTARVRVKICGLQRAEDAEVAIALGADALGFNTWSGSKRCIDLEREASWLAELPPFVSKIALTVNAPVEEAVRIARLPFIDAVQLHGDEDAGFCRRLMEASGRPVIKALRIRVASELEGLADYPTGFFLLDAHVPGMFGGTGVQADLNLATAFRARFPHRPLILAGGLRPENVAEAIRLVRPYAVDVSSGVESSPGRKDRGLMRALIEAVRDA
jgi:phosphoribosylanthranilate isomerase